MKRLFAASSILCIAVFATLAMAPAAQLRAATKEEKRVQKIEKKLSRFKPGTYLHLQFNNNTECSGTINTLSDASFTFNNADSNAKETHLYAEVFKVEKGKQYIGEGSAPTHHIHVF